MLQVLYMVKPVGGRGKQAPYKTSIMRVPEPLVFEFEKISDRFREAVTNENISDAAVLDYSLGNKNIMEVTEAIEQAKKIVKSKKGAAECLAKLLQVIYGGEITKEILK